MNRLLAPVLTLLMLVSPIALAEEAAAPPQYLNIFTAHVKLGHQAQFESNVKDLWAAMKETGADFPIFVNASASSPGDYNFVTFLDSMADLDTQRAAFNKAFAKLEPPPAGQEPPTTGNESQIIALRQDLSYQPENPRLAEGEAQFANIIYLYVNPPNAPAVAEAITSFVALNRKHGIGDGFGVSQNVTGEGPVFGIRTLAKSQADFYAQAEKNQAKLGEEAVALRMKVGTMLKRIEYSSSIRRADLDYQP